MISRKPFGALLALLMISGCATRTHTMTAPYHDADYYPYLKDGSATIEAQAFLRQNGGGVVTCAGADAFLFPETPFTSELVQALREGANPSSGGPIGGRAFMEAMRRTKCDAQGNFSFTSLPAGTWYIGTDVIWTIDYARQGGTVVTQVVTSGNGSQKILLSDSDLVR